MYKIFVIVSLYKCYYTSIDIMLDPFYGGRAASINDFATNINLCDGSSFSVLINSNTDECFCLSMVEERVCDPCIY